METNLAYQFEEEQWEEVIGGKVVIMSTPSTNHNRVSGNIYTIFDTYLYGHKCEPFLNGTTLFLEEGIEEYKPDMMVVCDPDKLKRDGVHGAPDLAVEVLSNSTARHDRGHKKDVYEKHGVREYWIVDPVRMSVEQYVLENGKFILRDVYHNYTADALADMKEQERAAVVTEFQCSLFDDLTISVERIFRRVVL